MLPVVGGHLVMRRDSVVAVVDSMARTWTAGLRNEGFQPPNFERFAMATLYVHAGDLVHARQHIEQWLAAPGLSATDRDWILSQAVNIFLDWQDAEDPAPSVERIAIARQYMVRLKATPLPSSDRDLFVFGVYRAFMTLYTGVGANDSAVVYGVRALSIPVESKDYGMRMLLAGSDALGDLAMVLAAFPERYQRVLDSVIVPLRKVVMAPVPESWAKNPTQMARVKYIRTSFERQVNGLRAIGAPAVPLIATQWFNMIPPSTLSDSAPGARLMRQDDGMVRVLGFGFFDCPYCQNAMKEWEKFQHKLPPGAACLWYERSNGYWGADAVEPGVEAEYLRHDFLDRKHYTYPIAVWAGPKERNEEGGLVPHFSPTMGQYGFLGGPHIVIVDGHGIVRWRGNWNEKQVLVVVNRLIKERQTGALVVSGASPTPTPSSARANTSSVVAQ